MSGSRKCWLAIWTVWIALSHLPSSHGVCDMTTTSAIPFNPIPPQQYDRNYSAITSTGSRPLGYVIGRVLYNSPTVPNPCIRVCSTGQGRSVEVMVETSPRTSLCLRDSAMTATCDGAGYLRACQNYPALADNCTYFEFYLNSQGLSNEADVNFWYRFVVSNETDDNWCFNRDSNEYPGNLAAPLNITFSNFQPDANGGVGTQPLPQASLLAPLLAAVLLLRPPADG